MSPISFFYFFTIYYLLDLSFFERFEAFFWVFRRAFPRVEPLFFLCFLAFLEPRCAKRPDLALRASYDLAFAFATPLRPLAGFFFTAFAALAGDTPCIP